MAGRLKKKITLFQLTRNILGTKPRVTRFKIDWDDSVSQVPENSENVPPAVSTESESNQMALGGARLIEEAKQAQVVPDINNGTGMDIDETSISMS